MSAMDFLTPTIAARDKVASTRKLIKREVDDGREIIYATMTTGCDGLPLLNPLDGSECAGDSGDKVVLAYRRNGVLSLVTDSVSRVFAGTRGGSVSVSSVITGAGPGPASVLVDSAGNIWSTAGSWLGITDPPTPQGLVDYYSVYAPGGDPPWAVGLPTWLISPWTGDGELPIGLGGARYDFDAAAEQTVAWPEGYDQRPTGADPGKQGVWSVSSPSSVDPPVPAFASTHLWTTRVWDWGVDGTDYRFGLESIGNAWIGSAYWPLRSLWRNLGDPYTPALRNLDGSLVDSISVGALPARYGWRGGSGAWYFPRLCALALPDGRFGVGIVPIDALDGLPSTVNVDIFSLSGSTLALSTALTLTLPAGGAPWAHPIWFRGGTRLGDGSVTLL